MITLPTGETMSFEECLDELKHTRDFELYLDMLNGLKDRYLIVLSVKEISGHNISDAAIKKLQALGFPIDTAHPCRMYVGVSDRGNILCSATAPKEGVPVRFEETIGDTRLSVFSYEKAAEIIINGTKYSLNERGLNFAVYDLEKGSAVDVSCCDELAEKPAFYHCNLYFDEQYLDSHIYMSADNKASFARTLRKSCFSNRKLNVREVEKGVVLPTVVSGDKALGGVCDGNLGFIAGRQAFGDESRYAISGGYTVPQSEMLSLEETVVYGGDMTYQGEHMIPQCLDRLWWLADNAHSELRVAVTVSREEDKSFASDLLKAFGIAENRVLFVEKPTRFSKVIVPDQSAIPLDSGSPYEFTAEFIQAFRHITKGLSPAEDKRIYLTKGNTAGKNIIGEDYFIDFFKQRGFRIVYSEKYTVKEKAEIMCGADEVVAADGADTFYAAFCKPTVRLTVLTGSGNYWLAPAQQIIEAAGIKDFYLVNASGGFFNRGRSDDITFMYVTEEFIKYVKDVYNEDVDITHEESLKKYLYDYLALLPSCYSEPQFFDSIRDLKTLDILRGVSDVLYGKAFDASRLNLSSDDARYSDGKDKGKFRELNERSYELIRENKDLKNSVERMEAENLRLRNDHEKLYAELSAVCRQNDTADEALSEGNRRLEELTKQLLLAMEEKTAMAEYIANADKR